MKKGEIIFKEGARLDKAYLIVDGRVSLTSTLGYEISAEPGDVIGEWVLIGESQESATAKTSVDLVELDRIDFSWGLLLRAFERLNKVDSFLSANLRSPSEVTKVINVEKKGSWKDLHDIVFSSYYMARALISEGKYEEAFRELMKIDKHSTDVDIINDSEIWKTFCLFSINPKNALRRYNALIRKREEYSKYISFIALTEMVSSGKDKLKTMVKLYLEHGILIPRRTVIMVEGEMGSDTYFVLSGYPRVARYSSGKEKILAFLGPGELVGEVATLGDVPRTATVLSGDMIQALVFKKKTLQKSVEESKEFGIEILKSVLNRIRRMRKLKEAGKDPIKRISILFEDRELEEVNRMRISLEEMAKYLSMGKNEVVSTLVEKKIASLRSDGTLRFLEEIRI